MAGEGTNGSANGVSPLLQSHETRIGRVEDGVNECKVGIAETNSQLKQLVETVKEGFAHLDARFDQHEEQDAKLAVEPRLKALEGEKKAKAKKLDTAKKAGIGLALTGIGAAVAKFGEHIASMWGWK